MGHTSLGIYTDSSHACRTSPELSLCTPFQFLLPDNLVVHIQSWGMDASPAKDLQPQILSLLGLYHRAGQCRASSEG